MDQSTASSAHAEIDLFGPPKDVPGECNARLSIGDDYGDNAATMRCSLSPGHDGLHQEKFKSNGGQVIVTWEKADQVLAEENG